MPATRRSMGAGALVQLTDNVPPPVTPGKAAKKEVSALKAELEKKDAENKALRDNIADLTAALSGLSVVREKIEADDTPTVVAPATNEEAPKKKKDKKAPAPTKTAYKFWLDSHKKPKDSPDVNMQQVWKSCAPEIRQTYEAMARADKERHARELAAYEEEKAALEMYYGKRRQDMAMELLDAQLKAQAALEKAGDKKGKKKKAPRDPEAPKRPLSSYMYFVAEARESVVKKNPAAAPKDVMKTLGEMWGQLEKGKGGRKGTKKYDDLAAEDKARYDEEKKVYDALVEERKKQEEQEKAARLDKDKEEALKLLKSVRPQDAAGGMSVVGTVAGTVAGAVRTVAVDDMSVVSDLETKDTTKKPKKKKDPNAPKKNMSAYLYFTTEERGAIQAGMPPNATQKELLTEVGRRWKALPPGRREKYNRMAEADRARYAREMETYNAAK